jgi:hypothetical protein
MGSDREVRKIYIRLKSLSSANLSSEPFVALSPYNVK